jgi:hypothetical protein
MKIVVTVATCNRPQWLRLFLLQMANQTVKPDVVVVHENGQVCSMANLFTDIPVTTDFIFTSKKCVTPDFYIPALRRALDNHQPDVVFYLNDDNIYFSDHIERTVAGLKDGRFDVSYLSYGNVLVLDWGIEYFPGVEWKKFFGNIGVDDGFALSNRAARQYLAYLEFASEKCKASGWNPSMNGTSTQPATDHPSDGVRFAVLHPENTEYPNLRKVNFVRGGTSVWVHHGGNLSSNTDQFSSSGLRTHLRCNRLWETGRI